MAKQVIRLSEQDFHKLINESVSKVLQELDWRTYSSAGEEASKYNYNDNVDEFEKERKKRQAKKFGQAADDELERKFRLKDFDANRRNKEYVPSQGELRRASKRAKEVQDFYDGKSRYEKGNGWVTK